MLPTRSFTNTIAPDNPVYVHSFGSGWAMYNRATVASMILLVDLGMTRLILSLSTSRKSTWLENMAATWEFWRVLWVMGDGGTHWLDR